LSLTSGGAITDASGASVTTTAGATLVATGAITLNDNGSDLLSVGGNANFSGTAIDIGPAGTFNAQSLTFNSAGNVTIQEDDATELTGTNTAAALSLTSGGALTDASGTSVTTTGDATVVASNAIALNDNAGDVLSVAGNGSFSGSAISIGSAGAFNAQSLTFNSSGDVTIQEDGDTDLQGVSVVGGNLQLTSAGNVTDTVTVARPTASLTVNGNSIVLAGSPGNANGSITLADEQTNNTLNVVGSAFFRSYGTTNSDIRLGTPSDINAVNGGVANFGSLGLRTSGSAWVIESSATHFDGVNVGVDLSVQSQDLMTSRVLMLVVWLVHVT